MEKVLQFLALYNTQLIKGGFAIIFLLLIIYVYRMFFVVTPANSAEGSASSDAIEQKLNQLLENHKNKAPAAEGDEATAGEIDRLKLEVYGLKQQLAEAEKKAGDASAAPAAASGDASAGPVDSAAAAKQAEHIKSLESRLAEYEIIAEDIAELSQLRTENLKLKAQLDAGAAAPVAAAEAVTEPEAAPVVEAAAEVVADVVSEPETAVEQPVVVEEKPATSKMEELTAGADEQAIQDALAQAAADEAIATLNENKNSSAPLTAQSAQDATDSLLAALAAEQEASAAAAVSEQDQKLLEEFEQTVVKKG